MWEGVPDVLHRLRMPETKGLKSSNLVLGTFDPIIMNDNRVLHLFFAPGFIIEEQRSGRELR